MRLDLSSGILHLSTDNHYWDNKLSTRIGVLVYFLPHAGSHEIRMNTSDIFLDFNGEKIRPLPELEEEYRPKSQWGCGGRFGFSENLARCGSLILTFPKALQQDAGFTLHLGTLQLDGKNHVVPDIKFCYVPPSLHWSHYHG